MPGFPTKNRRDPHKPGESPALQRKGTKSGRGRNGGGKVKTCSLPDRAGAGAAEGCGIGAQRKR